MIDHGFVIQSTGGTAAGKTPPDGYGGVSIDSRRINRGDLFFAVKGEGDGHDYVCAAFQAGAGAAVVERAREKISPHPPPDAVLISVPSTVRALGEMALEWRKRFKNLKVVCITGSNGKTTTKQALSSIVKLSGCRAVASKKSFNNHLGLPLTLLEIREYHEVCVAEVGVNAPGEMGRLARIAAPDMGAVTNIGTAHLGNFGNRGKIAEEKFSLFSSFGKDSAIAVNLDDPFTREASSAFECLKTEYGINSPEAEVSAFDISGTSRSVSFTMTIRGRDFHVTAPAVGRHNVMNFLCASSLALMLGISGEEIVRGIEIFKPAEMRMEVAEIMGGIILIDDCYNANPDSVTAALEETSRLKSAGGGRSKAIAVLGDMLELDGLSGEYHRQMGSKAAECGVDILIAFGKRAEQMCEVAGGKVRVEKTVSHDEAADMVRDAAKPGDVVLVKGSRGMEMEKITRRLRSS